MVEKKSFKQMQTELQEIADWFEAGFDELELAIEKYQQAVRLAEDMKKWLSRAEVSVKKIKKA